MDARNDTAALWEPFLASRSPELREQIILSHVSLVHYILGRMGISQDASDNYQELANQGLLGLIEAVDHYNPGYGAKFSTYASLRIRGKVIDYLRSQDWLSRGARKRARAVQSAIGTLWERNRQEPSTEEIAALMQVERSEVEQGLVDSSLTFLSLDGMLEAQSEEDTDLHDVLPDENQADPAESLQERETMSELAGAIRQLPQREQLVLSLYYHEELTLKEIGKVMGITESRVCQLHARAILNLKAGMSHVENFSAAS